MTLLQCMKFWLDRHLFEAVHDGSSVDPDWRVRLALYAACAVVIDLTTAKRLSEQRRVGVADKRRQSLDNRRDAVHRQRRVQLQPATSTPPRARTQGRPVPPGVSSSRPLRVDESEPCQIGAAVTKAGEVQFVHRLA